MRMASVLGPALLSLALTASLTAQSSPVPNQTAAPAVTQAAPPPKHALTPKERAKQQKELEKELNPEDKKWLNEDVAYIISPEERQAFLQLQNEDEREAFIEEFWQRRNPDPTSSYNQYKEDYYQRFAYANQHFAAGVPGWRTDRGRIYITWGKPNEEEDHDSGGTYDRPMDEGGGTTQTYPFEDWTYNYLEGVGTNVKLEFVDTCMCGDYKLTSDPGTKDALLHVPGAGLTQAEEMGQCSKDQRFGQTNGTTISPCASAFQGESDNEFSRIELQAKIFSPPPVKFNDLAEVVNHNISYSLLPFRYRTDFVKITDDTVLVPITLQIAYRDMTMKQTNNVDQAQIDVYGRISTITGRTVDQWDQTADVNFPSELVSQYASQTTRYWHGALLKPGRYKVNLVLKDVNSPNKLGTKAYSIVVPAYKDDELASSSIILADDIQKVPAKDIGTGQFILGDTKVRPVIGGVGAPAQFKRDQSLGIWMQIYNLKTDRITHKPSVAINYQVEDLATQKVLLNQTQTAGSESDAGDEITLEKSLPLARLDPSTYKLTITVTDNLSKQRIMPHADFIILN